MLKSNGLRHPKNLPVKFGFSSKSVPANTAQKLPLQCCSKPLLIPFSTSRTNAPRSLSRLKAGTHPALEERSHTTAHTAKQGRFGWGWYHYPRSVSHGSETLRGQGVERQTLPLLGLGRVLPKNAESLRNSDAHKRIAAPKAFCVLQERLRPSPKSGKVCRFKPRPRRVSETCGTLRG